MNTAPGLLAPTAPSAPMSVPQRLTHWLAHKTGTNRGDMEMRVSGARLVVGFRCKGCGKISDERPFRP
jgi:hypothetical protein